MKISARDEYALSAVLELAFNYDGEAPVRVQDIAQRQGIPMKFLFQIMQILKRFDVVRSTSGPFVQLSCLETGNFTDDCAKQSTCHFKPIWAEVDRAIAGILNSITFEELVRRARMSQQQLMYHI